MTTTNSIIRQNKSTLAYLEDEDYLHAIKSSMSAMAHLQTSEYLQQGQHQPKTFSGGTLDQCMLLYQPSVSEDEDHSDPRSEAPFIYSHGIQLPPTETDPTIITPIIIFNSALAYHLSANASASATSAHADLCRASGSTS